MTRRNIAAVLSLVVASGVLVGGNSLRVCRADDEPPAVAEEEGARQFRAHAREAAASYEMRVDSTDGRKVALREEPILRWTNPLGGRNAHGEVFVWTDDGRPAAVLSIYEYTAENVVHEHHEFSSLATSPLATAGQRNRNWSPKEAGLTFAPLSGAPEPAATPVRRLSQMRQLAARFTAEKTTRQDETRTLRLLTQPVYRYESKRHEVADGAIFSLVEATDPEIFLLLEARLADGKVAWHYGFVRMNSIRLAASLDGEQVWEVETLPWSQALNRVDLPYTAFTVR